RLPPNPSCRVTGPTAEAAVLVDPPRSFATLVARTRWHLARRRWISWVVVAGLAAASASGVVAAQQRAARARAAWGSPVTVLVATRAIPPGGPRAAAVQARPYPEPLAPTGALGAAPPGAVARQHIAAGEVVVQAD